ncbi:MAG TPA: cyclopropane-fatty-acyl-phospholipid synthase family protein [Pyrinomonadaceae bacterium]|jgi:cyclopropane-fatty-acyl-phospholipid synthase
MSSKTLFHRIFSQIDAASFAVEYWDGEIIRYGDETETFILQLKDENICSAVLSNLSVNFGEAYMCGAIDILGDMQSLIKLTYLVDYDKFTLTLPEKIRMAAMAWRQRNTLSRARRNIAHHYDVGNDFFSLWLGREMAYSCAYFQTTEDDIDTAQRQKFEHICRKLHLKKGETLIDVGCGWGGLAIHAAQQYGVEVLGITLSQEQKKLADERIAASGLEGRVRVELMDYREIPSNACFDKVVSVGMLEHVGRENMKAYFNILSRVLKEGGVGVVQSIGRMFELPVNPWITKYIFPGMYLPTLADMAVPLGKCDLNITDVEVLRLHYAMTLDKWAAAFEQNIDKIREMYSESFVRMWRFYLNMCSVSFRYGEICLWQVQFTRGLNNSLPLTRDYLYSSRTEFTSGVRE